MSVSFSLMKSVVEYLRPKKQWDLSEIENVAMHTICKLMKTAKSQEHAADMFKSYFIDVVKEGLTKFKTNDDYLHNIVDILDTLKIIRTNFLIIYREHTNYYADFNKWLSSFDVFTITNDVIFEFEEDVLKKHRDLAMGIYDTFVEDGEIINNDSIADGKFKWMK